jgi:uncharacterized protein
MNKILILFIFFITISNKSVSQNNQENVDALVKLLYSEKTIGQMVENYKIYLKQMATQMYPNEKDTNFVKFMKFALEKTKLIIKQMAKEDLSSVYSSNFSSAEINDLVNFYNSPTGKKYLEKSSEVQKAMQNIMLQKYIPILQTELQDYLKKK